MTNIDWRRMITAEAKAAAAQAATLASYEAAIQAHIDAVAAARGYRDGWALAGYATSTVPAWAAEAAAYIAWRDTVWVGVHAELARVQAGEREPPTVEGLIAELPAIAWPEAA